MSSEIVSKPVDLARLGGLQGKETDPNSFSCQVKDALEALKQQGIKLGDFGLYILALSQLKLNWGLAEELLNYPGYLNFPNDPAQALRERVLPANFHDLLETRWPNHCFEAQYVLDERVYYPDKIHQRNILPLPYYILPHYLRVVIRERRGGGRIRAVFNSFSPQPLFPEKPDFSQGYAYPGGEYGEFSYDKNGELRKILFVPFDDNSVYFNYFANPHDYCFFRDGLPPGPAIYEIVRGKVLDIPAIRVGIKELLFHGSVDDFFQALAEGRNLPKKPLGVGELFVKIPEADHLGLEVEDDGDVTIKGALQIPYYDLTREKGKEIGIPKKWFSLNNALLSLNNEMRILGINPNSLKIVDKRNGEEYLVLPFAKT